MAKIDKKKGKMILWGIVIAVVIVLLLLSLGFSITRNEAGNAGSGSATSSDYSSLPEKCRPPAGQDIEAWKQHLSHHAETQECLQYFN